MQILKRLFRSGAHAGPAINFGEGDLFYTRDGQQYQVHKLLKRSGDTWHVLSYRPINQAPESIEYSQLEVAVYHVPVHCSGFDAPVLLQSSYVSDDDLDGYHEFLKQTSQFEELAAVANDYFTRAYRATDEQNHQQAIYYYTKCINLAPVYWEAIDNRAFSRMDLGHWEDAIADFKLSLEVNRANMLAIFSIGECLFRLERLPEAKMQFEYVLKYDPDNEAAIHFLERTCEKLSSQST
jgi:tetratricopeptide (TPR) repeat protein